MSESRARALGVVSLVAGLPRVMAPWFFGWIATLQSTRFAFGLCAIAMAAALGLILPRSQIDLSPPANAS